MQEGPSMSVPNFKRIALFVQKLLGCPKISKLGHVTVSHAPFEPETFNLCRHPSSHTCCQILCFYLDLLLSNEWKQCEWAILMAKFSMCMRRVTWPGGRGHPKRHIWNQRPQFAYSLHNLYGLTMTTKGSLHGESPIVKRFSAEKLRFFGNKGIKY